MTKVLSPASPLVSDGSETIFDPINWGRMLKDWLVTKVLSPASHLVSDGSETMFDSINWGRMLKGSGCNGSVRFGPKPPEKRELVRINYCLALAGEYETKLSLKKK